MALTGSELFVTPGMSEASYPFVLTQGGDDRLVLNAKGVNKYHCRPEVSKNSREGAASLPPKPGVRMLEQGVNFAPCAWMKKHASRGRRVAASGTRDVFVRARAEETILVVRGQGGATW
jgi:hypothetical protein